VKALYRKENLETHSRQEDLTLKEEAAARD
jgi:hypothetical protein